MAQTTEKTFSKFDEKQAKTYARTRPDYHPSVYEAVIYRHRETGGQFGNLVDVGCGPGLATKTLASHFEHATGLDPSEGMVSAARSQGILTSTSSEVRFEVSTAEDLGQTLSPPIGAGSVDLISAANAAHWFDMPRFWNAAARLLKPGGSVALWTSGEIRVHPSMPNAEAIQAALDKIDDDELMAFYEPGNLLTRNGYRDLPLPWTADPPVSEFDESTFFRKQWDTDEKFTTQQADVTLDMFEKVMENASPVRRWREAHPDDVGTERDVVKMQRHAIERLLHEAGVKEGEEKLRGSVKGVLLVVKRT